MKTCAVKVAYFLRPSVLHALDQCRVPQSEEPFSSFFLWWLSSCILPVFHFCCAHRYGQSCLRSLRRSRKFLLGTDPTRDSCNISQVSVFVCFPRCHVPMFLCYLTAVLLSGSEKILEFRRTLFYLDQHAIYMQPYKVCKCSHYCVPCGNYYHFTKLYYPYFTIFRHMYKILKFYYF